MAIRQERDKFEPTSEQVNFTHDLGCLTSSLHHVLTERLHENEPFVVRIAGFGSLGKSTLANHLAALFSSATVLGTDGFMPDREERKTRNLTNGDDPAGINFEAMRETIAQLTSGRTVDKREYNHQTGRHDIVGILKPSPLIILEGACALYHNLRLPISSYGIFLDAHDEIRAFLRHEVNVHERGYSEEQSQKALPGYLDGYRQFVLPSIQYADVVCMVDRQRRYQSETIIRCGCASQ